MDLAQLSDPERLRVLLRFARETRAQLELPPLVNAIPGFVVANSPCDAALVALYDTGLREIGRVAAYGVGPTFPGDFADRWRQLVRTQGPSSFEGTEMIAALGVEPRFFPTVMEPALSAVQPLLVEAGLKALLAMPLIARGELHGVLVTYFGEPERATSVEVAFLTAIGDEVGAALHNARLYAQSRREVRRRDALRQVVESISSELDLNSLLEQVVRNAVDLLDASGGSITLMEQDGSVARLRAVYNLPEVLVGQVLEPGQGITGIVLETRQPVVVADYFQDLPTPMKEVTGVRASIGVPILWQGRLVGGFAVFDSQPSRVFDDHDREMMGLLATHVAIAIENARLYGALQSHVDELLGLQKLSTAILEEHDFDRVLQVTCEQLLKLTDASGVGLALLEEYGRFLELRTVVGPSADLLRGARIPLEGSFAGEAIRSNQPLRTRDAQSDPRAYQPSIRLGATRSLLSVPMKTRERTVGALSIYNKRGSDGAVFTERDAELATLFANQAAVAIENARLYEQTREYAVIEERNRLARELHDSVTQSLFSVSLLTETALSVWDRDPAKARERLERARELASGALTEMRALIFELRPTALQQEGLVNALKKHLAARRSRESLNAALRVIGAEQRLPAATEEALFRIVQESLNNVVKHASATRVEVTLTFQRKRLKVCTIDNGKGFRVSSSSSSASLDQHRTDTLGMSSMRERAESVGGTLVVRSTPGKGTRVCVEVPLRTD